MCVSVFVCVPVFLLYYAYTKIYKKKNTHPNPFQEDDYEKYLENTFKNLEVELKNSFRALQEVKIFLPSWLNKETNLRTAEGLSPDQTY